MSKSEYGGMKSPRTGSAASGRSAADIRGPAGRPAFSGRRDFTASLSVMRRAFTSSSTHRLAAAPICRPEASRNTFARG